MEARDDVQAELPLDGRTLETHRGTWTINVRRLSRDSHDAVRQADLTLAGTPSYGLTLKIPGAMLVVDHQKGDVEWILGALREWLRYPDPKGRHSELVFGPIEAPPGHTAAHRE